MTVAELLTLLQRIDQRYLNAPIAVEGWNEMGDFTQVRPRGDLRLERDRVGAPVVVLR